jgi:hypothetical protein
MPKPVYILCSESGSLDAHTNLVSHYQVIEQLQIAPIPESVLKSGQPVIVPQLKIRITAVWMREPGDSPEDQFESQVLLHIPPEGKELVVHKGIFSFGEGKLHRSIVAASGPTFPGAGVLRVVARVRRPDQENWLATQEYPVFVEVLPSPTEVKPEGVQSHP